MVWVVNATPLLLYSLEREAVRIAQEAGWTPGLFWTMRKVSPPLEFEPLIVQLVASRYINYAIPTNYVQQY
jgi:hypothetical protein